MLEDLGFDPLPYYREVAEPNEEYPLSLFIGLPEDEYFRSGQRHIPELRQRVEDPIFFMSEKDTRDMQIDEGAWVRLKTTTGEMLGRVFARSSMPKGLVRVPHGWWKPESRQGGSSMSGMWAFCDAQLTADDDLTLVDWEKGVPHLKGCPCSVTKLTEAEVAALEAEYGSTTDLPRGPEGKALRPKASSDDFMYDEELGEGLEFEASELSLYGRYSM